MRRPTRTRKLSIVAIVSLLLFGVVLGTGIRSLWNDDLWETGNGRWGIDVLGGRAIVNHHTGFVAQSCLTGHVHRDTTPDRSDIAQIVWGFVIRKEAFHSKKLGDGTDSILGIPICPLLLLLLIAPARWLIARNANAPAFPVLTDPKRA